MRALPAPLLRSASLALPGSVMNGAHSRSSSSEESSEEDEAEVAVSQELLLDELSAETMAALQSHLQRAQESSESEEEEDGGAGVSENFGLSQFWVLNNDLSRLRTNVAVLRS